MSSQQIEQLVLLWKVLPHPSKRHVVRLFSRVGETRYGDFARSLNQLKHFAQHNINRNVYIAPNPTCSTVGARHTAKEVTHWSYFLIDMDPICTCPPDRAKKKGKKCTTCAGKADPRRALDEALMLLGEWMSVDFSKQQPIIIDSGRGAQAWIRLEDIELSDEVEQGRIHGKEREEGGGDYTVHRATARRVNSYWLKKLDERLRVAYGCRIDTSVSDLPRVMRCPGTFNMKTKRATTFVTAPECCFAGFAHLLTVGTPQEYMIEPETKAVAPGQKWQMVFCHLTKMAQDYLTLGKEEPGRHKVMWHTAKKLAEVGVSRVEARRALSRANKLKGPDMCLSSEEVEHALDTAYET